MERRNKQQNGSAIGRFISNFLPSSLLLSAFNSEEARNLILEVARNRPGTHVAKCIQAYDEQQDLASLVSLLEELSKNTDYSTDLRISLVYVSGHKNSGTLLRQSPN